MHRQLRPSLAKGREWYHDDDVIAGHVAEAIDKYGRPDMSVTWTEPKRQSTRPRRRTT